MVKVEIGGDSQSTDGTESSHMHSKNDLDYERGYEWWLLSEAKKRNPNIKTYGLPWAYPGWVGGPEQSGSPFTHPELTSEYILKWLEGARKVYSVEIDYIGIWNERASDATYAKTLRKTLDAAGFANTTLVAKDGDKGICDDMAKDKDYAAAIGVVGLHYPSDYDDYSTCRKIGFGVDGGSKPTWASEESSSYDDLNGAACWARIITSHWVLQGFTSSIMWNLVGSYYHGTNWYASSMLTAVEPWTGNYNTLPVVWASAHITQFTEIGWNLLKVGHGSGQLPNGGFYATYADPKSSDWTLTIVKIDEDHAPCTRPALPSFNTTAESVTFVLADHMAKAQELSVWYSNFEAYRPDGTVPEVFTRLKNIQPVDGKITIDVPIGSFFTISTILNGPVKGKPETPIPKSSPSLPLPVHQDFEGVTPSQEAAWWADQIGAWEVHYENNNGTSGNKVMQQMVPEKPIGWSDHGSNGPMTLLGMREWQDITITAKFRLPASKPETSGCLGSRVDQMWADGIVFCAHGNGNWTLSVGGPKLGGASFGGEVYLNGTAAALPTDSLSEFSLTTVGRQAWGTLNGKTVFSAVTVRGLDTGFAALGAGDWYPIQFDDVRIEQAGKGWHPTSPCGAAKVGDVLHNRACAANGITVADEAFEILPDWAIRHIASGLCAEASASVAGSGLKLAACEPKNPLQQFKNDYTNIRNQIEPMVLQAGGKDMVLTGHADGTVVVELSKWSKPAPSTWKWMAWTYFPNSKQLRNQYTANTALGYPSCLTTCA